jgi:hypothetical protein
VAIALGVVGGVILAWLIRRRSTLSARNLYLPAIIGLAATGEALASGRIVLAAVLAPLSAPALAGSLAGRRWRLHDLGAGRTPMRRKYEPRTGVAISASWTVPCNGRSDPKRRNHCTPRVHASHTKGAPEWMPIRSAGGSGRFSQPSAFRLIAAVSRPRRAQGLKLVHLSSASLHVSCLVYPCPLITSTGWWGE